MSGDRKSAAQLLTRLGSVPADPEQARELFQKRLGALLGFTGALYGGVWISNAAINALFYPDFAPGKVTSLRSFVHGVAPILLLAAYAALRGKTKRSLSTLLALDLAACLVVGLALCGMVALGEAARRPDMVAFLVLTQYLVLHSALIPSTVKRSVVLGLISCIPLFVGVWILHSGTPKAAVGVLATAVLWTLMTLSIVAMVSLVIYGLRERVQAAMRFGQYTLEAKLGAGGMGVVYRAKHALLRRPTAVKLLLAETDGGPAVARFAREVQMTARLSHPNIVSVYDFGRSADGRFYYAMEYLDGIDLEQVVKGDGPQHPGRVRMILSQAADALAEAHGIGLIHRDIKPANMILCQRPRRTDVVKLVDFGLVKDTGVKDSETKATDLSDTFSIKGTPHYLSPEAITSPDQIDAGTDLYGLGAVGYFLLTGQVVFEGTSVVEVCAGHIYKEPIPPSERTDKAIPGKLEAVILRCLAKQRKDRFATASDLLQALRGCEDTPTWTVEDSQAWWAEQAPALRKAAETPIEQDQEAAGMMIDLGGRT